MLVEAIEDAEESVAEAAAKALVNIGDTRAVEPLIQVLRSREIGARRWAATALGELKDTRAAEPLISAVNDDDAGVRAHAARGLGMIGTVQAVVPLESALRDAEGTVREAAVYALASIDDPRARELVESALSHNDLITRTAATKASKKKANPNSIATLLANLETRVEELSTASAAALEALLERSASAAGVEDLRAIARLQNAIVIGTGHGEGYLRTQIEIDCRRLKQLACRELLRRGLPV
jgi:HEAT repeat protein